MKCGTDPQYFIRKYVQIEHPVRGLIPFDLYDYQDDLLEAYSANRFNIVLKARQLGISETTAAYALWLMLFRRNKNIVVIATKKDTARNIIRKIHTGFDNLPEYIKLAEKTADNVYSVELSNGSRIKAVSTAKDAGRSEAGSLLIIDEAAHIEGLDEIWTGLRPVVTAGGSVIMLSTPKGVGNTFHRIYTQADAGNSDFNPTKLMWWVHPERVVDEDGKYDLDDDPLRPGFKTSSWFRNETKDMDSREIAQELECNFNASGDTVIDPLILQKLENDFVMVPFAFEYIDRALHIWARPHAHTNYFITADVARGDGEDYSAFHVLQVSDMSQVAEYKGKVPTEEFAHLLTRIGNDYNGAMLIVENNNVGLACLEHIKYLEYENVYYSAKSQFEMGHAMNTALPMLDESRYVPGFTTSHRTRPLIIAKMEEYIRLGKVNIRSQRLIEELKKFIWDKRKPVAQKGYNDDLVISLAIACWIHDTFFASSYMTEEVSKHMLDMISYSKRVNTEIPGASKQPEHARLNERFEVERRDPFKIGTPDGTMIDIGWLIYSK